MTTTALCCTDGSELSVAALVDGLAVIDSPDRVVVVTVIEPVDPTLAVGTGLAGGVMTAGEVDARHQRRRAEAQADLVAARVSLGATVAETMIAEGEPGPVLCAIAESLPASVIVIGTRGRSGIRRAVLGSVSDHVIRNVNCPVVITGPRGGR